jgi:hypothetical protein
MIFDAAKAWIMKEIVEKAVQKVLSMLDPTGIMAVVRSAQAIFNAIQSVLDYVRELLELVDSYVSTVAAIAKGDTGSGAVKLEKGLADSVPVAIGFLANQAGLSDVPEQIKTIVLGLQEKIMEGLEWLLDKAIAMAKSILGIGGEKDSGEKVPMHVDETVGVPDANHHLKDDGPDGALVVHSDPTPLDKVPGSATIKAEIDEYYAARKAYDAVLAGDPEVAKGKTRLEKATAAVVEKVAAMMLDAPLASAPNIAMVARHGKQVAGSRQTGPMIWQTQSEHVLPFMENAPAWVDLGMDLLIRGKSSTIDDAQTTVITYREASKKKDNLDKPIIAAAKAAGGKDLPALLQKIQDKKEIAKDAPGMYGDAGIGSEQLLREYELKVTSGLEAASVLAVARTVKAVKDDHLDKSTDPQGRTNGERRGEKDPIPDEGKIKDAASKQVDNLADLISDALEKFLG